MTEIAALPISTRAERLALRLVQLGAFAVVLVASTHKVFDLDRFFVPKELVLHVTAALAGLLVVRSFRRATITWLDAALLLYLLMGAVSTLLAENPWLGMRALAVSASGVLLFWVARTFRNAGLARALVGALAFAVVLAAVTSLLQTYGLRLDVFALNRAPGGTLGNRNFVAHAAAFGFPVVLLAALYARRGSASFAASLGVMLVTASLVLTRSRAAWLAFGAMIVIFLFAMLFSGPLRRDGRTWKRLFVALLLIGGGVAAALLLPNTLNWRSDNPYLDSVKDVTNYQEGSGRGRLIQYEHSLKMAAAHALLGVGPGNWPVWYPEYAARRDPSLDPSEEGMTYNPWPSSDWIAFISERGFPAFLILAVVFVALALTTLQRLRRAADPDDAIVAAAMLATLAAAAVAGAFDAVLLLALPTFIVWTVLGALWLPMPPLALRGRTLFVLLVVVFSGLGAVRSASQLVAMDLQARHGDRESLERASRIDPGSYRLHLRLARIGKRQQRCEHALAARSLFPAASAARSVASGCSDSD
ncbi:MAG TPA: O-antigen ligase family protein [Thermoanaerobaculia bacterium]|jgi:O-antigen ligase